MKRTISLFLLMVFVLSACGETPTSAEATELPAPQVDFQEATLTAQPSPTPFTLQLTDALGRNVTIAEPPQRVISLSPFLTSSIFASGLDSLLVGRDSFSLYPEEAEALPSLGDKFADFDTVQFQSFNADLVLADVTYPFESIMAIESLGIPVFIFPIATSLDEVYSNISLIGILTDNEAKTDASIQELDLRASAVQLSLEAVESQPYIFYELEASDPTAPWTYGAGTILDEMFQFAGAQNAAFSLSGTWVQLPLVDLQSVDPAVILLADAAYGVSAETLATRPGWGSLTAVAQGQVLAFDETIISQPGPRIVDAIEELATLLHPDLYP